MAVDAVRYEHDLHAWSLEQARLLRAGRFDQLDVGRLAEEIEAVGQRERRELSQSMAVFFAQLLQWAFQPARRGTALEKTITAQRKEIRYALDESHSLMAQLEEPRWRSTVWAGALAQAVNETGSDRFPAECPWAIQDEVLIETWWP